MTAGLTYTVLFSFGGDRTEFHVARARLAVPGRVMVAKSLTLAGGMVSLPAAGEYHICNLWWRGREVAMARHLVQGVGMVVVGGARGVVLGPPTHPGELESVVHVHVPL